MPTEAGPAVRPGPAGQHRPAGGVSKINSTQGRRRVDDHRDSRALRQLDRPLVGLQRPHLVIGHLEAGRRGPRLADRSGPAVEIEVSFMINSDRYVVAGRGGRREHRGVVDRRRHDPGADPAPADRQTGDRGLRRLSAGAGEHHLVRAGADRRGDDVPGPVERLGGQPSGSVQPQRITPPGPLGVDPGLLCIWQHRLTGRRVQEDLRKRLRHAAKSTRRSARGRRRARRENSTPDHP